MVRRPVNAAQRLELRAAYIPKGATPILEHENGSALYTYELAGRLYAIAFWGTAAKSMWHHSFRNEAQRNEAILRWRESVEHSVTFRTDRQAKRKADTNTLKVGDILHTSWGYDQTNVDFYIVTRATKASVWVRQILGDYEATGHMSGRTWPKMPIEMTGPETRHVARGSGCSIKGHHASIATGDCYTSSYA